MLRPPDGRENNAHQFCRELHLANVLVNRQVVNSDGVFFLGRLPTYHTSRPTGRRSMVGFIRYLNGCRCESPPAIVSSRICSTANKSSVLCKSVHRSSDRMNSYRNEFFIFSSSLQIKHLDVSVRHFSVASLFYSVNVGSLPVSSLEADDVLSMCSDPRFWPIPAKSVFDALYRRQANRSRQLCAR